MTLAEIIVTLEAEDPRKVLPRGFDHPHSYRGYYDELAFEPASNVTVGDMLKDARSALGAIYQGWKGGDYEMSEYTDCWLSMEGSAGGETIGPLLLSLMLADGTVQGETATVAEMIREFHGALGETPHGLEWPTDTRAKFRHAFLVEEVDELADAIEARDMVGIADALADITYVVYGTAFVYGIPLDKAIVEVHRSNMTKDMEGVGEEAKAVKGERFERPNIAAVLGDLP